MTKPKSRILKQKKSPLTLAEQFTALGNLRNLVRRIEADRIDRSADPDWGTSLSQPQEEPRHVSAIIETVEKPFHTLSFLRD